MASSSSSVMSSLVIFVVVSAAIILTVDPASALGLDCGKSLSKECGDNIGKRVISNKGHPPSDECCISLVKIGKACHDTFTLAHIKAHDYRGKTYPVVKRSEELWHECAAVAKFAGTPKSN